MISELQQVLAALDISAEWIGLRAVRETASYRNVRDGLPQSNGKSLDQGVMVEVLVNGQIGYGAVNAFHPERIQQAAEMAYLQAIAASNHGIYPATVAVRPKVVGQYHSPFLKPLDALTPGEINDLLVRLCKTLKVSDKIVKTSATAITNETESWFVSSNGSEVYQKFVILETHYSVTAQDGPIVQQRSNNGYLAHCYQGGWELFLDGDLWGRSQQIGEQAVELLTAEDCPNTTTTLVLAPDQMMLQIHESIGHPLELDRILGDERNFAGTSFVSLDMFGHYRWGSELLDVTYDPTPPHQLASFAADDDGTPARRVHLIERGILKRPLGGALSVARARRLRSDIEGVATSRTAAWNRAPIDRMSNLNIEPGRSTLDEMIGRVGFGVMMRTNASWSIDDSRNKFQFGCEWGRVIRDGRLAEVVRNPNYRGVGATFWRSLAAVGDASTHEVMGTPFCGKGEPSQVIRVGHAAPACLFDDVDVFGAAA